METTYYNQKTLCGSITVDAFGPAPEVSEDLDHIYKRHLRPDILKDLRENPHAIHNHYEVIGMTKKEYNDIERRACDESLMLMASEIKDMIIKLTALYLKITFKNNIPRI